MKEKVYKRFGKWFASICDEDKIEWKYGGYDTQDDARAALEKAKKQKEDD